MTEPWPVAVRITPRAHGDMRRLPPPARRRVRDAIDRLAADDPRVDLRFLRGSERTHRLRVGDYRLILDREAPPEGWTVLRVLHRREAYR